MITRDITICGKTVTLAYCYATEIAYKDLSDENIGEYINEAVDCIQKGADPDVKRTILAILACMLAYYNNKNEDTPIEFEELMSNISPSEFATAIITVLDMRIEFYHVPTGEPADKKDGTKKKGKGKAKN
jgi:hypothetical protein